MVQTTYFVVGVCSIFELLRKDLRSFVNSLFSPDPKSFLKKEESFDVKTTVEYDTSENWYQQPAGPFLSTIEGKELNFNF